MKAWRRYNQKMAAKGTPKLKLTRRQVNMKSLKSGGVVSELLGNMLAKVGLFTRDVTT